MAIRGAPAAVDRTALFGEYPFLPGAETLLGGEALSVRALLEEPAYERARTIGRARILAAQDDPRASRDLEELSSAATDERYLSFLFARLALSAGPSLAALRRWAVAEAKRAYGRLRAAPVSELEEVAQALGFTIERAGAGVRLTLTDYLHLATPIREAEFRLTAQEVHDGAVVVPSVRAARLLQEAVRLELSVAVPLSADVVTLVRSQESALLTEVARRLPAPMGAGSSGPTPLRREAFPPCIRRMRRTLEKGENLSHAGRFALAAFLHRAGADAETIVDAYRGAPDFDESVTRYQVEHITSRDGGRGYEPPECDTLRSHGLCARDGDPESPEPKERGRDALCFEPTLRHPLQYYRRRGGTTVGTPEATPAADGSAAPERRRSTAPR